MTSTPDGWSSVDVYDVVAATVPDREMVVCGDVADVVLVDVDDASGVEPLPGSTPYEDAARTPVDAPLPRRSPGSRRRVPSWCAAPRQREGRPPVGPGRSP
jgi:hypothetical protein